MREEFRTLLTGEPLEWQLTNEQRIALSLAPIEPHWVLREVPCGLLAMCETYAYFDGLQVMRVISTGENYYTEVCVDAALMEEGRIAPVKPGGKSVPLTAANLHKRRHTGASLTFDATRDDTVICVQDHDSRLMLLDVKLPQRMTVDEFAVWIASRCKEDTP